MPPPLTTPLCSCGCASQDSAPKPHHSMLNAPQVQQLQARSPWARAMRPLPAGGLGGLQATVPTRRPVHTLAAPAQAPNLPHRAPVKAGAAAGGRAGGAGGQFEEGALRQRGVGWGRDRPLKPDLTVDLPPLTGVS